MADRRSLVPGAALEILADRGERALTHREVDRLAGLPLGSTANLFSTREALLAAVVDEFERQDAVLLADLSNAQPNTLEGVIDTLVAYVDISTGTDAARLTKARLALFLARPDAMRVGHRRALDLLETLLDSGGVRDPADAARRLAAYLDGNALHAATGVARPAASSGAVRATIDRLLR